MGRKNHPNSRIYGNSNRWWKRNSNSWSIQRTKRNKSKPKSSSKPRLWIWQMGSRRSNSTRPTSIWNNPNHKRRKCNSKGNFQKNTTKRIHSNCNRRWKWNSNSRSFQRTKRNKSKPKSSSKPRLWIW